MIRAYALEGKNWLTYLPKIQFKLNSRKDESRKKSPFEILYRTNPRSTPYLLPHPVTTYNPPQDRHHTTQENLAEANKKQSYYTNKRMTSPPKLESGQMVLLSTENIKFYTNAPKTLPLYMGPFPVQTFNHWFDNYTLDFSSEPSMTSVVNLFHISKLKEYKSRDRKDFPLTKLRNPEPVKENLYAAKALEFRTKPETGKRQYLIRWMGYSLRHDKWVYSENITNDVLCA